MKKYLLLIVCAIMALTACSSSESDNEMDQIQTEMEKLVGEWKFYEYRNTGDWKPVPSLVNYFVVLRGDGSLNGDWVLIGCKTYKIDAQHNFWIDNEKWGTYMLENSNTLVVNSPDSGYRLIRVK